MSDLPTDYDERVRTGRDGWVDRMPASVPEVQQPARANPLDSRKAQLLHARLYGYYRDELERQGPNRRKMQECEECYDGKQWTDDDMIELDDRGQVPLVFNLTATTVNWVLGTEKRNKKDYKILPRTKASAVPAQRKTDLMKYLSDVNKSPFSWSEAFEQAVKAGVGFIECGVSNDGDGEPIYERMENWRNILWDSAATQKDLAPGNCRYMIRFKWVDLDVAEAFFPQRRAALRLAAVDAGNVTYASTQNDDPGDSQERAMDQLGVDPNNGTGRQRVRLIEIWFCDPEKVKKHIRGDYKGEIHDPEDPDHMAALVESRAVIADRMMMRMNCAIMTESDLLWTGPSPYRHNKFPFTPIWGYRFSETNLPYGMVHGLRDINFDLNKRASKALSILSGMTVTMDEGAVENMQALEEELGRPNAIIVRKPGKNLELHVDRNLADAHMQLMNVDAQMIQNVGGVTDENLGKTTNARSGVAIEARQEQGGLATASFFDNQRLAFNLHGEKVLSLIEQYMHEPKQFRITNSRGKPTFIDINDGLPENDIASSRADFIISEEDWRASVRRAQSEELLALMGQLAQVNPQIVVSVLDLVVESLDMKNGDEIVKRIRQVTGMRDPDATEMTPEEMQHQQKAAEQEQRQTAAQDAEISSMQAEAALKAAQAKKADEDTKGTTAKTAGTQMDTLLKAYQAGVEMGMTQQLIGNGGVSIAEGLLDESGFKSAGDMAMKDAIASMPNNPAIPPAQAGPPPPQMPAPQPQTTDQPVQPGTDVPAGGM